MNLLQEEINTVRNNIHSNVFIYTSICVQIHVVYKYYKLYVTICDNNNEGNVKNFMEGSHTWKSKITFKNHTSVLSLL